jgi:Mg-chelatase subunit ChlD
MAAFNKFLILAICLVSLNKNVVSQVSQVTQVSTQQSFSASAMSTQTLGGPTAAPTVAASTMAPSVAPSVAPTFASTMAPSTMLPSPGSTPGSSSLGLDRECACTVSKIWLDIVAVIDVSKSMTQEGLSQVQANLDTIVHELTLSKTTGYNSRISIITFASSATTVAALDAFNNTDDFENSLFSLTVNNADSKVNILSGLQAANSILGSSSTNPNRRRVVIVYTSAYDNGGFQSPIPLSEQMREDNVKLITVAFAQSMGSSDVDAVGELAWPGFAFTNNQSDLIPKMYDSLCQANCFCPPNWRQFSTNFTDKYAHSYGNCLYFSSITAGWTPVSHTCRNEAPGAYLVSESTQAKKDFNLAYSKAVSVNGKYTYHIGLEYKNGAYSWQTSNSSVTVPLDTNGYTNWNPLYPNEQIGNCVKADKAALGNVYGWTNENCWTAQNYICEVNACDTDNYCQ